MSSNDTVDLLMAKTVKKNRKVAPGRNKQYDTMIVTSIREALATEDLQMWKAILSIKFDFYMMHIAKLSDYSCTIVNRNNQLMRSVLCLNFEQLKAVSSHSMDRSGTRTCSESGSIVIAVVSSAKDIILRSKQTALKFIQKRRQRRHKISADVHRVAIRSQLILNVVFLKVNIFAEIL